MPVLWAQTRRGRAVKPSTHKPAGPPRLLDAFSGAGGAAEGYRRAGFHVTGVDIAPQPRYAGDEFFQADALEFLAEHWSEYDAVHASPPCQAKTTMSNRWRGAGGKADSHPDLLLPTWAILDDATVPVVIENVPGYGTDALPLPWIKLHGAMFGLGVHRPRIFWSNRLILEPSPQRSTVDPVGVYGKAHDGRLLFRRADGTEQHAAASLEQARAAMGIDWMEWRELAEAIPPAYTEFIGAQLLDAIKVAA